MVESQISRCPLAMKCTCVTRQRVFPQKSRLNNQTFRPTSCWTNMFDCLAASLNIAFESLPMIDVGQTLPSNIWFQANISPFTHLFKQSKPEQEKSNQSETEHLVLSKELINVNWRTTDEARNVNFQNPCTVANSHLSTPLIEPNFYVQLPHRRGSTVSLETIPFRNRLCRHPRHNFSADTQEVLRGLTLLVVWVHTTNDVGWKGFIV